MKKYKLIDIPLGTTIAEAVNELLKYKKKGELVYCVFNGMNLYSDTITINQAYSLIFGT